MVADRGAVDQPGRVRRAGLGGIQRQEGQPSVSRRYSASGYRLR